MELDEWRGLIEHWTASGHDIRFLDIPVDVATALKIELPEETEMTEATVPSEESGILPEGPLGLKWKRKKYFPADKCGLKDCKREADGYIMDIRPTGKSDNGRLWFGPACMKCVRKGHKSLNPMTLAELAYQRNGASDLALILDVEVGEVLARLTAGGIDEKGRSLNLPADPTPADPAPVAPVEPVPTMTQEEVQTAAAAAVVAASGEPSNPPTQLAFPQQQPPAPVQQPQPEQTALALPEEVQITTATVVVPAQTLAAELAQAQRSLVVLQSFHIVDQEGMNTATKFVQKVKRKWKEIDDLRKDLGKPLRDKIGEIQALFNLPLGVLAQAETLLKQKIDEGSQRAHQAQQAALQQAQAALQAGDMQGTAAATQQVAATNVALPQGVHMTPVFNYEIVDPAQVPGDFWSIDPVKIKAAIAAGHRQIPGVHIFQVNTVNVRG